MITFDKLIDLMPIVAHRRFGIPDPGPGLASPSNTRIRDRNGRCPICALVNEIDPALSFRNEAGQALECLLGRQLTERELLAIKRLMDAADWDFADRSSDRNRRILKRALEVRS